MIKTSDKNSGNTVSITIEGSSTLDTSEIDEMIENAEKFAASDKESRSNKSPGFRKRLKASVTKLRGDLVKRARNAPRPPLNLVKLAGLGVLGIFLYR